MQLTILTIISICSVIGVVILWELRALIKEVPERIIDLLFKPFHKEIKDLKTEITRIKNDLEGDKKQ